MFMLTVYHNVGNPIIYIVQRWNTQKASIKKIMSWIKMLTWQIETSKVSNIRYKYRRQFLLTVAV